MSVYPAALPTVRPAVRSAFEQGSGGGAASIIAGLFAQGQQGFWLPFTDFDSLSQDSAGTLPYTALEQPVGRVLDRSGRGNHASQPTSTARGVVSALVNALTETEFRNGAGDAFGFGFEVSSLSGYLGALRFTNKVGDSYAYKTGAGGYGQVCRLSCVVKMDDGSEPRCAAQYPSNDFMLVVNGAQATPSSIVPMGGGLFRVTSNSYLISSSNTGIVKYSNNSAKPFTVTAYSLVPVAQASLPYQRVTTTTDYDAVGFPKYLRLDGTDDSYTCGGGGSTTGFYYSDVITHKQVPGANIILFSDIVGNSGYEILLNSTNGLINFRVGNGAIIGSLNSASALTMGIASHVACYFDGATASISINGVVNSVTLAPAAAGSATITLFKLPTGGNYFNGQITEPIYRAGPPPNAYERDVIRNYQRQKAGML